MALLGGGGKSKGGSVRSGLEEKPKIGLTSGTGSHKYWKKYKSSLGKWIYIYKKPGGGVTTAPIKEQVSSKQQFNSGTGNHVDVIKPGSQSSSAAKAKVQAKIDSGIKAVKASQKAAGVKSQSESASDKESKFKRPEVKVGEDGHLDFSEFDKEVAKSGVAPKEDTKKSKGSSGSGGGGSSGSASSSSRQIQNQSAQNSEESKKLKDAYNGFAEMVRNGSAKLEDLPESVREEVQKILDPDAAELERLESVYGDFVKQIEDGKISIDDVPETIREDVQKVLTAHAKEKENGPSLDKPLSEIDTESQEIKEAESFVDELLKKKED